MTGGSMDGGPMDSGAMDSGPMDSGPMDCGPTHGSIGPACRRMLRSGGQPVSEAIQRHAADCAFCTAWLRGRNQLQAALRTPVSPLSELDAASLLDGVRDRLIEQCEDSPLGLAVADTLAPVASADADRGDASADGVDLELPVGLADRLRRVPGQAPEWGDIRDAVFAPGPAEAAESTAHEPRRVGRRATVAAGTAGLAAAALLCVILLREGEPAAPPTEPEIVFANLTSLDGVEFSPMRAVRHGGGE